MCTCLASSLYIDSHSSLSVPVNNGITQNKHIDHHARKLDKTVKLEIPCLLLAVNRELIGLNDIEHWQWLIVSFLLSKHTQVGTQLILLLTFILLTKHAKTLNIYRLYVDSVVARPGLARLTSAIFSPASSGYTSPFTSALPNAGVNFLGCKHDLFYFMKSENLTNMSIKCLSCSRTPLAREKKHHNFVSVPCFIKRNLWIQVGVGMVCVCVCECTCYQSGMDTWFFTTCDQTGTSLFRFIG